MLLRLKSIKKSFGSKTALSGVEANISPGRVTGLLGPNGAGKTTLIRIILGIINQDEGSISFSGEESISQNLLGYVPEENALYGKSKVLENLLYFASLKGMDKKTAKKEALDWLERLNADEYSGQYVETLSKGNRQKVQIAASLIHNPEIIIWDEPFSGLDPIARESVITIMKEESAKQKVFLVSTHQLDSAEKFCDSIILLHQGKLLLSDDLLTAKKIFSENTLDICSDAPLSFFPGIEGVTSVNQLQEGVRIEYNNNFNKSEFIRLVNESYTIDAISHHTSTVKDIFFRMVNQ